MTKATQRQAKGYDSDVDAFDVPAAIVCAHCGKPECPGCAGFGLKSSGVIAIVPWERPHGNAWSRMLTTAKVTTQNAELFFSSMPDGEISAAIAFAFFAELLAVLSMLLVLFSGFLTLFPGYVFELARDELTRRAFLGWLAVGVPGLTTWVIAAHAMHGAALNHGAQQQGAANQSKRALRFGLYACGWDVMNGPIGLAATFMSSGVVSTLGLVADALRVPNAASMALLTGVYRLTNEQARRARRVGTLIVAIFTGVTALLVLMLLWIS